MINKINSHEIIWDDEKVSRFWDYISHHKHHDDLYFTKMAGAQVMKYLDEKINLQNKTILDYGSGPGYLFEHIKKLNRKISYYALDFSEKSINTLRHRYSKYENFKNAYFVNKFPTTISERFDLVAALEVIEHLDDEKLNSMISEIKTLLKKNGYVFITTPNNENLDANKIYCPECGCVFHRWQHMRIWNTNSLKNFMEQNGFITVSVMENNWCHTIVHKGKSILKKILGNVEIPANLSYLGKKK